MAEKRYYWLKLKENYFTNPKIKKLRKIAGGDTYTIIYLKMQLLSVSNKGIIEFEEIESTFEEELALKLDEQLEDVQLTMAYLRSQNLVETNNNKFLFLDACNNIGSESDSAERVRQFRIRQNEVKSLQCNESVTEVKRSSISISNSISNNNINSNNKEVNKFKVPTIDEVKEYCLERKNNVDPERFIDFYSSKGWLIGKNKMKDWKACVRTWEKTSKNNSKSVGRSYTAEQFNNVFDNLDEVEL